MSSEALGRTGSRTISRRAVTGAPTAPDLLDGALLLLLIGCASWGFRTTFDSPRFMVVSLLGALIGIGVAHVATILRQQWFVVVLLAVVAFFLFGGAVALHSHALAGILPTRQSVSIQATLAVSGWKDLLTTLPPVDGSGQFLVLPYLLALATGAVGFGLARRSTRTALPVLAPVALLAIVILLGTLEPAALLVQGLGFTTVAFCWVVLRRRRLVRTVGTGSAIRTQGAVGAVLLVAAMGGAAALGGHLPGSGAHERVVLRTYVAPPFDITQYPSPLVGFRKYTQGARLVWDQQLLAVRGVSSGTLVRFAVMDDYSGTVWSAGNTTTQSGTSTFRKVGPTIPATGIPATGPAQTVAITVSPAYAGLADADVWVPGVGYPSHLTFSGPGSAALTDSVRYNTGTGQAVVPTRLAAGDVVRTTQTSLQTPPASFRPFGTSTLDPSVYDFVSTAATKWGAKRPTAWEQLQSIADAMRTNGAYSDGTRTGETQYLPGHGTGRLQRFLALPQLVGNDEQYAATFALMANDLGIPARVVMGAVVEQGGVVKGQDVHAWVEIRGETGDWYTVPYTRFMPDRDKPPTHQPPQQQPDSNASNVPPPNALRPPGASDGTAASTNATVRPKTPDHGWSVPAWLVTVLRVVGYPVTAVLGVALLLALLRGLRRRRRRSGGPRHRRMAQGWRDYVDHARDLGYAISSGLTRTEQSVIVGQPELARQADRAVFGAEEPSQAEVDTYWSAVADARRELTRSRSRTRRIRRLFALRGLLARDRRPVEASPHQALSQQGRGRRIARLGGSA